MIKLACCSAFALLATSYVFAQGNSANLLTVSGYAEVYYQQDFNRPLSNTRPGFVYSHNRTGEVALNLAFIKASLNQDRVRANLAIAAGTYMNANYAVEPGVLKNLYEANIGVKLSAKQNLWLDAGVMPSHLGFESATGKDNWTLTRSLFAENSPYFETGIRLGYASPDGRWYLAGYYLNGWQRIQRVDGNTTPAFGHQVTFKPTDYITLNSSSFIGNDKPDSTRQMRYFHNFYALFQLNDQFGITAGFDVGMEQKEKGSDDYNTWYTPVLVAKYSPAEKISLTARGEYYRDEGGVLIATGTPSGFRTWGYSLNVDYQFLPNLVWRTEIRKLDSREAIFSSHDGGVTDNSTLVITALAVSF